MGAIMKAISNQHIDFAAVSNASRGALESIASRYLPSGKREGSEWVALNPTRNDAKPGSFKFNLKSGAWSDFATGDKGGDAIDLIAYLERKSKLEAARELAGMLGVKDSEGSTSTTGNIRRPEPVKAAQFATASPDESRCAPESFPPRTPPDKDGKPRFTVAGDEGPRIRDDEKRRHVFCRGGVPVRIKIIRKNGDAFNVYRVTNNDGVTGWQWRKPEGFQATPYFVSDPFQSDEPIYWPEGEKDVDSLARMGAPAFTFGGTGDGLPSGCEQYVAGHSVVILADNDDAGREHADKKAAAPRRSSHFPRQRVSHPRHLLMNKRAKSRQKRRKQMTASSFRSAIASVLAASIGVIRAIRKSRSCICPVHSISLPRRETERELAGGYCCIGSTTMAEIIGSRFRARCWQAMVLRRARRSLMAACTSLPAKRPGRCSMLFYCRSALRCVHERHSASDGTATRSFCRTIVSAGPQATRICCRRRLLMNIHSVSRALSIAGSRMLLDTLLAIPGWSLPCRLPSPVR